MSYSTLVRVAVMGSLAATLCLGCGAGSADVGSNQNVDGGPDAGTDGGTNSPPICTPSAEVCDGVDNDCNGQIDDIDADGDGFRACGSGPARDCDDANPDIHPGAPEVANDIDDNCDGKIDLGAPGTDYDGDGVPFETDCNDEEPLVGPNAVEVPGDSVDNDCNGQVDEVVDCEAEITGNGALDFLRAMGLCGPYIESATFVKGSAEARSIRSRFGTNQLPKLGTRMVHLSSGKSLDRYDNTSYVPQSGHAFSSTGSSHPLWSAADCHPQSSVPSAQDLTELKVTLKVPQNAKSFSYQLNFFSSEYPEYVCTQFNDRFIAILESTALDPSKLPGGEAKNCIPGTTVPQCNISFDAKGQPLTINSGFFDVCQTAPALPYSCGTPPLPALDKTGYDVFRADYDEGWTSGPNGGATGWLTTTAPVTPGETITLRFLIFDEGDSILDSSILLDNFRWEAEEVEAPSTEPVIN